MQITVILCTGKHIIIADIYTLSLYYHYDSKNGVPYSVIYGE